MYYKCVAWVSSTDCLSMTSTYQLLHPSWRKYPRRIQYGWTGGHETLLQTLHHQILNGEIPSCYYTDDVDYTTAAKKHLINYDEPFLTKPVHPLEGCDDIVTEVTAIDNKVAVMDDDDDDDDEYVHADIAYTEQEIEEMYLSNQRYHGNTSDVIVRKLPTSSEQTNDNDFIVYSIDVSSSSQTNQMREAICRLTHVDSNRNNADVDVDGSTWEVISCEA